MSRKSRVMLSYESGDRAMVFRGGLHVTGRERAHRILSLTLAVCELVHASPARADDYRSSLERAVVERDRALETDSEASWESALESFADVLSIKASKEAKFEFANAAAHLHRDDEACAAYADALELGLAGRAELQARDFILARSGQMSLLEIAGPAGGNVYVRGRKRAVLPISRPLLVSAGSMLVRIVLAGARPWETTVFVAPDAKLKLSADLEVKNDGERMLVSREPTQHADAPAAPPRAATRWGMPVLVSGSMLTVIGSGAIVVTSLILPSKRAALSRDCIARNGDECANALQAKRDAAQSDSDAIATLKTLRGVGYGAAAVGVAAMAAGLLRLRLAESVKVSWQAPARSAGAELSVTWNGTF